MTPALMLHFKYSNPAMLIVVSIALLAYALWTSYIRRHHKSLSEVTTASEDEKQAHNAVDPYAYITSLPDFEWSHTLPLQIRAFKPKFYMTMGLENIPFSDWLAIDNTYLDRLKLREKLINEHPVETHQCHPSCNEAMVEMYEWVFGTYLPKRFPTMFTLLPPFSSTPDVETTEQDGKPQRQREPSLLNITTGEHIPLDPASATEALRTLGRNVDNDLLFLLPSASPSPTSSESHIPAENAIYHLDAYVCCFPSGFSLPQKFRHTLAEIHAPVPGYKAKLERSMDRYFARLPAGKLVRRHNWAITTNPDLYREAGNHLYADDGSDDQELDLEVDSQGKTLNLNSANLLREIEQQRKDVRVEDCRLRAERQTLHRLPRSGALVFAFKTYTYPLHEIKAEGSGPALAEAIEGLRLGNAPELEYYKRGVVWGDRVREYLLS